MRRPLAYYGDPILRKKCKPVDEITDEIRELVNDMVETMTEERGQGIAAPQVSQNLRIFVTRVPIHDKETDEWTYRPLRVFINPTLSEPSDEEWTYIEGCLSIPELSGQVTRPWSITIEATDLEGNRIKETFHGPEARCIMHENDHINGVLFIDRMERSAKKKIEQNLREIKSKYYKKK